MGSHIVFAEKLSRHRSELQVFVATKNAGKLRELQAIFGALGWTLEEFADYCDPEEVESSYAGNAALKARALSTQLRAAGISAAALGDDSGLEVGALDGKPGVRSARYGAPGAGWRERRATLLGEVERTGSTDRSARFVCALHLVIPDGREFETLGTIEGRLAESERGEAGFSYDPIFEYPPCGRTFAELSESEKNVVSHRARAAARMAAAYTGGDARN